MNSCLNMSKSLNGVFVIWMIFTNMYHLTVKLYQGRRLWSMRESWPRFSSCPQGKGSAMFNKQIWIFLDKVTKVHAIGLMLDDRWMYQKIEGCLLVYFLCRDGRSFRVPALPSLKRTVGRLGPCPNDGCITCISHHWIQTARRKYLGKVRCETLWNCPNFCQVSTRDIWIQATTAAPGVWGVLLGW